jgi:energy-coupling factor transport system ATP-binding protein
MIELRDASFSYPSRAGSSRFALESVSLKIPRGSYTAVMGPNGSGKSTLGKLVKGLLSPSSGEVRIAGQPLKKGEISPRVGYIFSNPENQIVSSVVEEDIAFGLGNLGMDPGLMSLRVEESLRLVGMEEYRYHSPHLLSGGQQQKIVIAGILAMECEVLVLDEPASMLDLRDRREILDLFAKLHRDRGITILHITHSLEEALRAQALICLEEGRIVFNGRPEDYLAASALSASPSVQVPPLFELIRALRGRGHAIPPSVGSPEELAAVLAGKAGRKPEK